jgi:hypothetical protein
MAYPGRWSVPYTGLAMLDGTTQKPEYILSPDATERFFNSINLMTRLFHGLKVPDVGKLTNRPNQEFNAPLIKNEIINNNYTPFDVDNNTNNINRTLKAELHNMGLGLNMV